MLFDELTSPNATALTVLCDNQAAITIAHHPEFHTCTKHMDIALQFLCNLVKSKKLQIQYTRTSNNLAGLFTKGLPRPAHMKLTEGMGMNVVRGGVLESTDDQEGEPTKMTAAGTAIGRLGRIGDGGSEEGEVRKCLRRSVKERKATR